MDRSWQEGKRSRLPGKAEPRLACVLSQSAAAHADAPLAVSQEQRHGQEEQMPSHPLAEALYHQVAYPVSQLRDLRW